VKRSKLLDEVLRRELAPDERIARSLIMQGKVLVDGKAVTGEGMAVPMDAEIELVVDDCSYVSRGGLKLRNFLQALGEEAQFISGNTCIDVGASTGGFTEVLLEWGAAKVYAVDVGVGLLDGRLRSDERVVPVEGMNARELGPEQVPEECSVFTVDVSFISGIWLLQFIRPLLVTDTKGIVLLKPQFERQPDPEHERKGWFRDGVVLAPELHREVLLDAFQSLAAEGWWVERVRPAEPRGAKGNVEFFLLIGMGEWGLSAQDFTKEVDAMLGALR
jgi:23S rRNA (cytidine1920-2'-O)/16S rRNA (cytidine1409-2'-O)-methyltransferase